MIDRDPKDHKELMVNLVILDHLVSLENQERLVKQDRRETRYMYTHTYIHVHIYNVHVVS